MNSKIILIYPRLNYPIISAAFEPLGIQYLASLLKKEGQDVEIIDFTFDSNLERLKKSLDNVSFIGFSFTSPLFNRALKILNYIKSINKEIVTIAGGPHPTVDHASVLNQGFDYVAIGEGETIIKEFSKFMYQNMPEKTKGIAYKRDDKIIVNEPATFIDNLDDIAFPARDLIDYSLYGSIGMITSRGCKFNCLYCQPILRSLFGKNVRERSIQNIIEEIDIISHNYPKKRIRFEDDTFTMQDLEWFELFKDELSKRKLRIKWQCNSRVDTINIDKAKIMKECGCTQIGFGVESGSKKILDFYRKGTNPEQTIKIFNDMKKVGILTHAFIMLGAPIATKEDLDATYEVIKKMKPDKLMTCTVTPLPGSDLFNYCKEKELLNVRQFEDYDNSINSLRGVLPIKLKFLKEKDLIQIKQKIDLYIFVKSMFNIKILRILINEPNRIIRVITSYIKKYFGREFIEIRRI